MANIRLRAFTVGDPGTNTGNATAFSDSFNRANNNSLGKNWGIEWTSLGNGTITGITSAIVTQLADAAQGCSYAYFGANNPNFVTKTALIPLQVYFGLYQSQKQFAQFTFLNVVANFNAGLVCFYNRTQASNQAPNFYFLSIQAAGTGLYKQVNAGVPAVPALLLGGGPVLSANDVIRLSVDSSTAGQTTITGKRNGVTFLNVVDVAGTRLTEGIPGIYADSGNQTGRLQFRNFSCGIGL